MESDIERGIVEFMDTFDARFQRIADAVRELGDNEREHILAEFESLLFEPTSLLTSEQRVEIKRRMSEPRSYATQDQVEAVFAKFR